MLCIYIYMYVYVYTYILPKKPAGSAMFAGGSQVQTRREVGFNLKA